MKHVPTFENFVNENKFSDSNINEKNDIYVSDPRFNDETTLKADILKNIGPALDNLLARHGIKYNKIVAEDVSGRRGNTLSFKSKPMTGQDLGFMQYGFSEVYIGFFGGGNYPQINKSTAADLFEFSPYIWAALHYSYKLIGGGSNGCSLILPGEDSDSIYYDIIDRRWLTNKEAGRRTDWR